MNDGNDEKAPAFQFYVRDWIASLSVMRMTGDQVKAYAYLMSWSWLEKPRATLPMDDHLLADMARVTYDKWMNEIKPGITPVMSVMDNRYVIPRLLKVSKSLENARKNGKKGGNPNLKKGQPNPYYRQKDIHNQEVKAPLIKKDNQKITSSSSTSSSIKTSISSTPPTPSDPFAEIQPKSKPIPGSEVFKKLRKWFSEMADVQNPEALAKHYTGKYSDRVISKALGNSNCTSRGQFVSICEHYKNII